MIRCEHCGSPLLEGAIFCGECGRAVTAPATRRAPAPASDAQSAPPPLRTPGTAPDPAAEAWLPESTLDPATRAWLTGADRGRPRQPEVPAIPVQTPDEFAPRTAPTHVHGAGSGLGDWTGRVPSEPSLDPTPAAAEDPDVVDAEATRIAPAADSDWETPHVQAGHVQPEQRVDPGQPIEPWTPPVVRAPAPVPPQPEQPAAPSWWIDRPTAAAQPEPVAEAPAPSQPVAEPASEHDVPAPAAPVDDAPRPGDTAVVPGLGDRRTYATPAPLVAPGTGPTTCHVCGHTLEPDDIFCEECGAVRPAVTAAFTGPVVPLPVDRPDWSFEQGTATDEQAPAEPAAAEQASAEPAVAEPHAAEPLTPEPVVAEPEPTTDVADAAPLEHRATDSDDLGLAPVPRADRGSHRVASPPSLEEPPHQDADRFPGSATIPSSSPSMEPTPGSPLVPPLPPVPRMADASGEQPPAEEPVGLDAWARARGLGEPVPMRFVSDDDPVPTSADADEDDVEATRIVGRNPERAPLVLHFSTGERAGVGGTGLVGRLPRAEPGERFDALITIVDPGKSVSKTHLEIGRDGDDLWVSDRFSGNGTVVRHIDGSIRRCEPGRRYRVERGARVDIGEQFFLVQ